jgi:hypothetical protein
MDICIAGIQKKKKIIIPDKRTKSENGIFVCSKGILPPPSFILAHCRHGYRYSSPFCIGGRTKTKYNNPPLFFNFGQYLFRKEGAYNRGRQLGVITKNKKYI